MPPESLLSADTVLFLRYDGYQPHLQAYDRTTLARVMKDDLGEFLDYLGTFSRDLLIASKRVAPDRPAREKAAADANKFADYLWRHGIVVGLEIGDKTGLPYLDNLLGKNRLRGGGDDAAGMQGVVVFPQGGIPANRPVVLSFIKLLIDTTDLEPFEKKEGDRNIFSVRGRGYLRWWQEGDHVILLIGTEPLQSALDVIEGRKPNLTSTPLFKELSAFKSYETDVRGLVNLQRIFDMLRAPAEKGRQLDMAIDALTRHLLLHQLGVNGIKGLTFHMGFSGKYQRSTLMLHVPERADRSGLLRALTHAQPDPKDFDLDRLPPLPPDADRVRIMSVDWLALYDYVNQMTKLIALAEGLQQGRPPDNRFSLDAVLNLDFRKDVLETLDSTMVIYGAPSDGFFYLGQSLAIKVKDSKKLLAGTEAMNKALIGSGLGRLQKRPYRGVDMQMFTPGLEDAVALFVPLTPTFAIHKDWFVLGVFPQSVKGSILRSEGGRKVWRAPDFYKDLLARSLKEAGPKSRLAGVSVVDPVPNFELGLGLLPVFAKAMSAASPVRFDVSKLPSTQAITEFAYPKVGFYFDDDTALRWESHFSVDFPLEYLLLPYLFFGVLSGL